MCSHIEYLKKFTTLFKEDFESWVVSLLKEIHPNGDFCAVKSTRGDGGLDGYSIGTATVYQIHAPENATDRERAKKIAEDFAKAYATTEGGLKKWVFIRNDKDGEIGKESTTAIGRIKKEHSDLTVEQWGRDELWKQLQVVTGSFQRAKEALINWSVDCYGKFLVPALQLRLPISMAWNRVASRPQESEPKALRQILEHYREWPKLGDDPARKSASAFDFVQDNLRSVIVGGPGSGKSTLSERLIYEAAHVGHCALRVGLRQISILIGQEKSFAEALYEAGLRSAPTDVRRCKSLVDRLDLLILDGLDEAEPIRTRVAEEITHWANGHPDMMICVTTRGIGYRRDLLSGFAATELLPLTDVRAAHKIDDLLKLMPLSDEESARIRKEFDLGTEKWIRKRIPKAVGIGIRNPLLLSFFVALAANGESLNGKRAALYGKMVDLVRKRESSKTTSVAIPGSLAAKRLLYQVANAVFENPTRPADLLIEQLAVEEEEQSRKSAAVAEKEIAEILQFWVERGMLERIQVGSDEFYSFAHPTLQEYCVASHLRDITREKVAEWTRQNRRRSSAREIFALSGGFENASVFAEALIATDDPEDPLSDECIVALRILAEMEEPDREVFDLAVASIERRLGSKFPILSFDVASELVALSADFPEQISELAGSFLDHTQPWTRLAGYAAFLASSEGDKLVSAAKGFLSDPDWEGHPVMRMKARSFGDSTRLLWEDAFFRAIEILAELEDDSQLEEGLAAFISRGSPVSVGLVGIVEGTIGTKRFRKIIKGTRWDLFKDFPNISMAGVDLNQTNSDMLKLVANRLLKAINGGSKGAVTAERDFKYFSTFLETIEYGEIPLDEYGLIREKIEESAQVEVLRGLLAIHELPQEALAADCAAVIANEDSNELNDKVDILFGEIASLKDAADIRLRVDRETMVRAFLHPAEYLHRWASLVIQHSGDPASFGEPIRTILVKIKGNALARIAELASALWGEDACDVMRARVESSPDWGTGHLFRKYGELRESSGNREDWKFLIGGVTKSRAVSIGAAEGLALMSPTSDGEYRAALREAFDHWSARKEPCPVCKVDLLDGQCPECDRYPTFPFGPLIKELVRTATMKVPELFALSCDPRSQLSEPAIRVMVALCRKNPPLGPQVFGLVAESTEGHEKLLKAFLESSLKSDPVFCETFASNYDRLSEKAVVELFSNLPSMAIGAAQATELVQLGMESDSDLIREIAVESFRRIEKKKLEAAS